MPRNKGLIEHPDDITLTEQDDIQEILGHPPGWILRWGITVVLCLVAMLFVLSWVVKYPDVISANVELTTENPIIPVFARQNGKLSLLKVEDQAVVDSGQVLAILENPADFADIQRLEAILAQSKYLEEAEILSLPWPEDLSLGSLQATYASFTQKLNDYAFFGDQKAVYRKIRSLREQIDNLFSLNKSLERQYATLGKERKIAQSKLTRDSALRTEGAVSVEAVEQSEAEVLRHDRQLETLRTQILNNKVRIEDLEVQIINLSQQRKDDQNLKELSIQENIDRLKGELNAWYQEFVLIAPINGTVTMSRIWSTQQFVAANTEVMTILPKTGVGDKIGRALMPVAGSGKVEKNLDVNINLAGYPSQEFGLLRGKVRKISPIPMDNANYIVEIAIPDTLVTTYNDTIPFNQKLLGTAEIITEDRRLIERFFDKILDMIRN